MNKPPRPIPTLVSLLLAGALACACSKDKTGGPGGPGAAAKQAAAPATPSADVRFSLDDGFWGKSKLSLTGPAYLDVTGDGPPYDYELRIFNATANATCDTEAHFGGGIAGDGWAFYASNDRMHPGKTPFEMRPTTLDGVSWTMYWRTKTSPEGTNSGNGADNSAVHVTFANIGADTATGTIKGTLDGRATETVEGTFTAKICRKPEKPDED